MGVPEVAEIESSRGPAARPARRRAFAATVLVVLGLTSAAPAQDRTASEAESGLVRGWSDAARALEHPASPEDQLRAIARLGAADNQRALDALILAVATHLSEGRGGSVVQGPSAERGRLRIALARALSAYADRPDARRSLGRLTTGVLGGADARDQLAAGIAATSLARSGDADALEVLGRALTQSAPLSDVARAALLAHPPRDLGPLLRSAPSSRAQIEMFAELGDQRAFLPLREVVRSGPDALRGPAALALFRLGALETQPYARHAFRNSRIPSERLAALQILVESGDELAPSALASALGAKEDALAHDPSAEKIAVELAALAPSVEKGLLVAKAHSEDQTVRELALMALARLGGPADFFSSALAGRDAPSAARALASSNAASLDAVLARALEDRTARPWALRALAVRLRRGASESARGAFERAVAQALEGGTPAEKAAAAWGLAVLSPERAASLVAHEDAVVRHAVLRQAFQGPLALAAARELEKSKSADTARFVALAPCLLDARARQGLSTQLLASLPERDASTFPGVAGAIAERQGAEVPLAGGPRTRIEDIRRWLSSVEPELRAATARGLGDSRDSASVGLLSELYRFESDARVRRATVRALTKRPEQARLRTLAQARELDPDPAVRALAALSPQAADTKTLGLPTLVWLARSESPVRLSSAWGETMVAFPDPDGFVGVVDFGPGPITTTPAPLSEAPVAKLRSARDPSP